MQVLSLLFRLFFCFFIDASGDPIMVNDAIMSSNLLVTLGRDE